MIGGYILLSFLKHTSFTNLFLPIFLLCSVYDSEDNNIETDEVKCTQKNLIFSLGEFVHSFI